MPLKRAPALTASMMDPLSTLVASKSLQPAQCHRATNLKIPGCQYGISLAAVCRAGRLLAQRLAKLRSLKLQRDRGPQRPAMMGASASLPTPARRLPSPVSTGPRRQTSPLLSGLGSSNRKRKPEDVQAYTSLDAQVQVQSWYADDPAPPAAVSASKRRKNG